MAVLRSSRIPPPECHHGESQCDAAEQPATGKKITQRGIEDISNDLGAYMVVRAESHDAAAKLFEKHPHFTIFPGERVEVMPVLPIPGG